jgi:hypothetical protein
MTFICPRCERTFWLPTQPIGLHPLCDACLDAVLAWAEAEEQQNKRLARQGQANDSRH